MIKFCSKIGYCFILLFGIFVFHACKTTEKATTPIGTEVERQQTAISFAKIHENQANFEWLTIRLSALVEGFGLSGQLKVHKNNTLWVSLNKLGFEVIRMKATRDSLFFLNRLENTYYSGDYKFFESLIGLDLNYNMLESLLIGNDFDCFDNENFKSAYSHGNTIFKFSQRSWNQECEKKKNFSSFSNIICVDNKTFKIISNGLSSGKYSVDISYSDFQQIESMLFPQAIDVKLFISNELKTVSIAYDKPSFARIESFPFSIPKNAKPIF